MSVTAIDTHQPAAALAIRPGQEMWTEKQKAALAVLGIRNASSADLAVFMHYCQKTALDPFFRQIYLIKRRVQEGGQWVEKWTIQVGIDGFRVIRDRVAERLGVTVEYEDTIWFDRDGGEHKIWLLDEPPAGCSVTVLKDGRRFPAVVRFSSYAATNKDGQLVSQWKTQPDHMIEKCAEAFALRRAFPHDLSGVYLEDEMPRQDGDAPARASGRVTVAEVISTPDTTAAAEVITVTPPGETAAAGTAEPATEPGSVRADQVGRVESIYASGLGFKRNEQALATGATEQIIGRDLTGPNEGRIHLNLSELEAVKLIDTLEGFKDRAQLTAFLETPPADGTVSDA